MNPYLLAEAVDIGKVTKLTETRTLDSYKSFSDVINLIIQTSIIAASIILVVLLIFGGITFIINAGNGDAKKADQGKKTITASIIGFAIVIFAYLIIKVIETFTGLPILESTL